MAHVRKKNRNVFFVEHFQSQVLRPILLRLVKKSIVSCHIYTTKYYSGESLYVKNIIMSTVSAATATHTRPYSK